MFTKPLMRICIGFLIAWVLPWLVWVSPAAAIELPDWLPFWRGSQPETVTPALPTTAPTAPLPADSAPVESVPETVEQPASADQAGENARSLDVLETPDESLDAAETPDIEKSSQPLESPTPKPPPAPLLDEPMKPEDTLPEIVEGVEPKTEANKVMPDLFDHSSDSATQSPE